MLDFIRFLDYYQSYQPDKLFQNLKGQQKRNTSEKNVKETSLRKHGWHGISCPVSQFVHSGQIGMTESGD